MKAKSTKSPGCIRATALALLGGVAVLAAVPASALAQERGTIPAAAQLGGPTDRQTTYALVPASGHEPIYLPKAGVKTNLLYLGTGTPNLSVEFGVAPRWTVELAAGLNPWDLNGRRGGIRHGLVQPEVRHWFCQRFERHFVGLHGLYGRYRVGDVDLAPFGADLTGKRYAGWGVGAGVSYGYHLPMGKRWGWEFTLGVGYIYLDYDRYACGQCDTFLGRTAKHYFGPTKAGVSLIYMLR